ncbi:equilibrative nucleoside transporter 3-like [Paramacrobiotus metropolitanus]|uniref:equilibrative nucleoside transporter 3-like n=1 Tax=Paramacrobiotus metropolitanus TaxID=2943436 RepID=UPI002445F7BC|nr:equilibrative nucleoside transporter 3-like [Paramacrobiotus metropolitanus]
MEVDTRSISRSDSGIAQTQSASNHFEESSDDVRLISEHNQGYHTKILSHTGVKRKFDAPNDRFNLAFLFMVLLGMSASYAWFFFVTASDYFKYAFRNVTNPTVPTALQNSFESSLAFGGTAVGLIAVFANTILTRYVSFQKRIVFGLTMTMLVFIITAILAEVDTDPWQKGFFGVTMLNIVIISFSSNLVMGALFGVQGCLPSRFATAIMVGQTFAGIIAAIAMIISVLGGSGSAGEDRIKTEACGYFASAAVMSMIAIVGFFVFLRLEFVKFFMFPPPDELVVTVKVDSSHFVLI